MLNDLLSVPNLYFVVIMLFFFVVALMRPNSDFAKLAPASLTSIGIIGTFFGLYFALKHFDSNNINASIPALLEGIKTKFLVSLAGIFLSLLLKIIFNFHTKTQNIKEDVSMSDLYNVLNAILQQNANTSTKQIESIELLRRDFSKFSEKVAQDNSKSLIEALQQVIKDFNLKISEQFGENFKQLNAAVGNLLDWQEKNKEEMTKILTLLQAKHLMIEASNNALTSSNALVISSTEAVQRVVSQMELIHSISNHLKPTLEQLNSDSQKLQLSVSAFADIGNQAKVAFPAIREELANVAKKTHDDLKNFSNSFERIVTLQVAEIDKTNKTFLETAMSSRALNESAILDVTKKLSAQIEKISNEQSETIKNQLAAIDKGLEEELVKALESLGNSLASLSEKFVSDYGPLTEKLEKLVNIPNSKDIN